MPGDRTHGLIGGISAGLVGLLLLSFTMQGVRVAGLPTGQKVTWNVVIDDGYYYLQVARNIARGHGATFDRINPTNGFQPLWALALVPIFWVTNDPGHGMQAMLILATVMGALSVLLFFLALRRMTGAGTALLTCTLMTANPYFLQILQGGLETPALFLCLAALMAWWAHKGRQILQGERRPCVVLGALMGLTVLSRVDTALILAPMGLMLAVWPGKKGRVRRALWIALPALALLLPYVGWNLAGQGSLVPVSGLVKRWVAATYQPTEELFVATEQWRGVTRTLHMMVWPHKIPGRESLDQIPPLLSIPAGLLLLLTLRLVFSQRSRRNHLALFLCGAAAIGVTAHGLYMFYIYRSTAHWNYHYFFVFSVLWTVLAGVTLPLVLADLGRTLDRLLGGRLRPCFSALALALCLPLCGWLAHQGLISAAAHYHKLQQDPRKSFRKCRYDAARYMAAAYPRDAVFGAWWAGTLGYFSDRRVVNLDGVINSKDYFDRYLKQDRVQDYITGGAITHLADFFWKDPLSPTATPAWRAMWWEHDKEHMVKRLGSRLKLAKMIPFQGTQGLYIMDVVK